MSWAFNKQHVAQKVLVKHMNDLDRKQARVAAIQDEKLRDVERELFSLHSVSTPDLGLCFGSPRPPQKVLPRLYKSANKSLTRSSGDVPTYEKTNTSKESSSRLRSRRQSEPVAMIGRDLEDIQRLMNKVTCLKDEAPVEPTSRHLEATMSGKMEIHNDVIRLQKRRGTIAHAEGLVMGREFPLLSAGPPSASKRNARRGSLPLNDAKSHIEETRAKSSKPRSTRKSSDKETHKKSTRKKHKNKRPKSYKELTGVNVSFYNEDTGEESIPTIPPLELQGADDSSLADEISMADGNVPANDSSDEKSIDNDTEYIWKDVAKCRYIRGYDPPEMRPPPEDSATYVFGRSYSDAHTERGVRLGLCKSPEGTNNAD